MFSILRTQTTTVAFALLIAMTVSVTPVLAQSTSSGSNGLSDVLKAEVTKTVDASKQKHAEELLVDIMNANQIPLTKVKSIQLLPSEELNAATDGETIVYSEGLWDLLTTDDQKAFVLAHELSHIQLNHIPKTTARRVGYTLLQRLLNAKFAASNSTFWNQVSQVGLGLTELKFSRGAEYGADDLGLTLMGNAGYDPRAAVEVFDLFEKYSPSSTPEFLRSHPLSRSRIERLSREHAEAAEAQVEQKAVPQMQPQQFQQRININ